MHNCVSVSFVSVSFVAVSFVAVFHVLQVPASYTIVLRLMRRVETQASDNACVAPALGQIIVLP